VLGLKACATTPGFFFFFFFFFLKTNKHTRYYFVSSVWSETHECSPG
jgi:hypothetical protein